MERSGLAWLLSIAAAAGCSSGSAGDGATVDAAQPDASWDSSQGGGAAGNDASAAKGGSAGTGGQAGSSAGGSGGTEVPADASSWVPGCSAGAPEQGDATIDLSFGGADRNYILHVPGSYSHGSPAALVINLHGYLMNASQQQAFCGMNDKSNQAGFVLAYPNGTSTSWNGGACCGTSASSHADDVGFIRAVVADIENRACIDPKRVYVTGMSNGGFLAHRLACEAADLFAAAAPVAAVLGIPQDDCKPSRPIPLIHFHGTADLVVPYAGNPAISYPSVKSTFEGWAKRDGCTGAKAVETFHNGAASCDTWQDCNAGSQVTLCTITGEGHCWPGKTACTWPSTTDISANDAMWEFFLKHTLP